MRIAFLYGSFSIGQRPFDFDNLYSAQRGLTGSELSCIEYALEMQRRGHEVLLVVGHHIEPREWRGLRLVPLRNPRVVDGFDVVFSWNEPDLLRDIALGPLRMMNQQLNDFAYCRPGWEEYVDVLTSPSAHHLEFLRKQAPLVRHWEVLPNGCNPEQYDPKVPRVPGRVVWASSADRGLHRLLEMWPGIKSCVPHATLRCFYNFQPADFDDYEAVTPVVQPDLLEIAQRKRYIQHAMSKLVGERWGVEHVGSVSRQRMAREFERAVVLGYPCDTIRYTEGFSVTTLESCASGVLPVITDVDSLGHIYGSAAPMVKLGGGPLQSEHATEFSKLLIRGLTDEDWREEHVEKCRALAGQHSWQLLGDRLEQMITKELADRDGKKKTKKRVGGVVEAGSGA